MQKTLAVLLAFALSALACAQVSLAPPATVGAADASVEAGTTAAGFRRVLLRTPNSRAPVVGKVIQTLQDGVAVELPNGSIQFAATGRYQPTEQPFQRFESEEIQRRLLKEFPGFKVNAKGRFVFVYNTQDGFYELASQRLEATYSSVMDYCQRHNLATTTPKYPMVIVLFATKDEFLKAGGTIARQLDGYYNARDNRTYMYQYRFAGEPWEKASRRCQQAIAHEGVHQILHNIGVQRRLSEWPKWISEGLAEYFVPQVDRNGVVAGNPNLYRIMELLSTRSARAKSAAARWQLEKLGTGSVIAQLVEANDLDSYGYAIAWSLTHYLANHQASRFERYVNDVVQSRPFAKRTQPELERFQKHFGSNLAAIEENLVRHVRKLHADATQHTTQHTTKAAGSVYLVIGASPKGTTAVISPNQNVAELQQAIAKKLGYTNISDVRFLVQKHVSADAAKRSLAQLRRAKAQPAKQ